MIQRKTAQTLFDFQTNFMFHICYFIPHMHFILHIPHKFHVTYYIYIAYYTLHILLFILHHKFWELWHIWEFPISHYVLHIWECVTYLKISAPCRCAWCLILHILENTHMCENFHISYYISCIWEFHISYYISYIWEFHLSMYFMSIVPIRSLPEILKSHTKCICHM